MEGYMILVSLLMIKDYILVLLGVALKLMNLGSIFQEKKLLVHHHVDWLIVQLGIIG